MRYDEAASTASTSSQPSQAMPELILASTSRPTAANFSKKRISHSVSMCRTKRRRSGIRASYGPVAAEHARQLAEAKAEAVCTLS